MYVGLNIAHKMPNAIDIYIAVGQTYFKHSAKPRVTSNRVNEIQCSQQFIAIHVNIKVPRDFVLGNIFVSGLTGIYGFYTQINN